MHDRLNGLFQMKYIKLRITFRFTVHKYGASSFNGDDGGRVASVHVASLLSFDCFVGAVALAEL